MGLDRDTTFTWYGHSLLRGPDARRQGRSCIDPWFGNPTSPTAADSIERCDLLLVTHGHFDHMGDAVAIASRLRPAWPCIHEMSLWLARRLPGGADAAIGMNKGGTVEAARDQGHDGPRRSLGRRLEPGRRDDRSTSATRSASSSSSRTASASTSPATPPLFGDMRADPRAVRARSSRSCRSAATSRWARARRRSPPSCSASRHVIPIHYGTFPILTGTPDELRAELSRRGVAAEVYSPEPGESFS